MAFEFPPACSSRSQPAFSSAEPEPRASNPERRTPNAERRTPNAERRESETPFAAGPPLSIHPWLAARALSYSFDRVCAGPHCGAGRTRRLEYDEAGEPSASIG
jgi:hypothetical protein